MRNPYKNPRTLLLVVVILISFIAIMPSYSKDGFQNDLISCLDLEGDPLLQIQSHETDTPGQSDCLSDYEKMLFRLYIFGVVSIDELTMWVLGVDRRVVVIKTMHEYGLIKASDIAEKTGRSLQNISHAIRELEEHGLIKCITPEKHTWKRFILTEKGSEIFEKLRKNHIIN